MIELVNARLVPYWLNVRVEPFPEVPAIAHQDWELALGDDRRVYSPLYHYYFVRSYVLSPDLRRLLNEDEGRLGQIDPHAEPYQSGTEVKPTMAARTGRDAAAPKGTS